MYVVCVSIYYYYHYQINWNDTLTIPWYDCHSTNSTFWTPVGCYYKLIKISY